MHISDAIKNTITARLRIMQRPTHIPGEINYFQSRPCTARKSVGRRLISGNCSGRNSREKSLEQSSVRNTIKMEDNKLGPWQSDDFMLEIQKDNSRVLGPVLSELKLNKISYVKRNKQLASNKKNGRHTQNDLRNRKGTILNTIFYNYTLIKPANKKIQITDLIKSEDSTFQFNQKHYAKKNAKIKFYNYIDNVKQLSKTRTINLSTKPQLDGEQSQSKQTTLMLKSQRKQVLSRYKSLQM